MAYWLLSALGFVLVFPAERRHLRPLLAATGIALLIYSPNFWWNWSNGFVSYLHTRDNAALSGPLFHPDAFIEFFASQFGVFGPLLFAGLILADRNMARPRRTARPPACRLYPADLGDDARRQPAVARPCQLGGADLCRGDSAGCRLGIAARLAQAPRCVDCAASRGSRPALYRPRGAGRLRPRCAGPIRSAAPGTGLARARRRSRQGTCRASRTDLVRRRSRAARGADLLHPAAPARCRQMEGDEPHSGPVGPDERSRETARRKLSARLRARTDQRDGAELCGDRTPPSDRHPAGAGGGPHLHIVCRARLQGLSRRAGPKKRSIPRPLCAADVRGTGSAAMPDGRREAPSPARSARWNRTRTSIARRFFRKGRASRSEHRLRHDHRVAQADRIGEHRGRGR